MVAVAVAVAVKAMVAVTVMGVVVRDIDIKDGIIAMTCR